MSQGGGIAFRRLIKKDDQDYTELLNHLPSFQVNRAKSQAEFLQRCMEEEEERKEACRFKTKPVPKTLYKKSASPAVLHKQV
jgi:hypothetical protein